MLTFNEQSGKPQRTWRAKSAHWFRRVQGQAPGRQETADDSSVWPTEIVIWGLLLCYWSLFFLRMFSFLPLPHSCLLVSCSVPLLPLLFLLWAKVPGTTIYTLMRIWDSGLHEDLLMEHYFKSMKEFYIKWSAPFTLSLPYFLQV